MSLSYEDEKKQRRLPPQKVVIPKGIINPEETTIIEIPICLHKQPIVVAKHKYITKGLVPLYNSSCRANHNKKQDYLGKKSHFSTIPVDSLAYEEGCLYSENNPQDTVSIDSSTDYLDKTEEQERLQLQIDLKIFQKARRRLLENTSKLTSQESHQGDMYSNSYGWPAAGSLYDCSTSTTEKRHTKRLNPSIDKEEYSKQLYETLD